MGAKGTNMMAPEYQRELYMEVRLARYLGYDSSVTNIGAAFATQVPSAKKRGKR